MKLLLGKDYNSYCKILDERYLNSVRCNTLKISPEELKKRLEKKWEIKQPYKQYPEIFIIEGRKPFGKDNENQAKQGGGNSLDKSESSQGRGSMSSIYPIAPGEIGKALEHQLGYYYVQEVSSMMPPLVLSADEKEVVLDIAAAPGSKTTQIAMMMKNKGTLIANDISVPRIVALSANLQRCGIINNIITREEGRQLCQKFKKINFQFDKILLDAPCSGEGTLRTSPKTASMFSENMIKKLSSIQKKLLENAVEVLKKDGILIYSTCTHAPEENEEVIDYILKQGKVKLEEIKLPIKTRNGITEWNNIKYSDELKKCARIYPMDNNTEGFFIAAIKKVRN